MSINPTLAELLHEGERANLQRRLAARSRVRDAEAARATRLHLAACAEAAAKAVPGNVPAAAAKQGCPDATTPRRRIAANPSA